jgi:hypothetical protein
MSKLDDAVSVHLRVEPALGGKHENRSIPIVASDMDRTVVRKSNEIRATIIIGEGFAPDNLRATITPRRID